MNTKIRPLVLIFLTAVAAVFFWLFGRHESESNELRQRMVSLERELAAAKTSKAVQDVPKSISAPAALPVTVSEPIAPRVIADELSPAEQLQLEELTRRRFLRMAGRIYGQAIESLSLDQATREKVLARMAEGFQVQADTGAVARKLGITDPAAVRERAIQEVAKVEAETKRVIGTELFDALLREVMVGQERTAVELNFAREVSVFGEPLTEAHSDAFARKVWENKEMIRLGTAGTSDEAEAALLESLSRILSSAQLKFYRETRLEDAQLAALNRKLNAKR